MPPDEALSQFLRTVAPGVTSVDALVAFYKYTPQFTQAIYYDRGVYLAHHSRMPKNLEVAQEIYAFAAQTLRRRDDFARRRREIDTAYTTLLTQIEAVGGAAPANWREAWRRGARIGWLVGMGLANLYQALSEGRGEPGLRERVVQNDREWQALDPLSYDQLRADVVPQIVNQA